MGMGVSKEEQEVINQFVQAAYDGDLNTVKELMTELNGKNEAGDTALHAAAANGHIDIVSELLEQKSSLEMDTKDSNEATALMLAAAGGHFEIVYKLYKAGFDTDLIDRLGWAALHHAAAGGHSLVVSYLMEKSKKGLIFQNDSAGCAPLWLAADSGDPETVRLLLLQGTDPDQVNEEGVAVYDTAMESEADEDKRDKILDMLTTASEVWKEVRERFGERVNFPEEEEATKSMKALDGTMEGPSIPVGDEKRPLINEDTMEKLSGENEELIRRMVIEALRLEEPFVETYSEVVEDVVF